MKNTIAIGIDIGGTYIKGGLVGSNGMVVEKLEVETEAQKDRETIIKNICKVIKKLLDVNKNISGIGISCPGYIDSISGNILGGIANIPALNKLNIKELLSVKTGFKIKVDNDANLATFAEHKYGAGEGCDDLLCITLGTGIGGGLVLNGKLYQGGFEYAGEIGHITVVPDGYPCTCGKRGCVEAYSSATGIVNQALMYKRSSFATLLKSYDDSDITSKLVNTLAEDEDDDVCRMILSDAAKHLAFVLAGAVNLLNLERIIIGGGASKMGPCFYDALEFEMQKLTLPLAYENVSIHTAKLENDAGIIGAASLFL